MSPFDPTIDDVFREYADLELRCHHLLLAGEENTPKTVAAEDRMEELWDKLDEVQRRSLSGMGSDLNWVRRNGEPAPKGRKTAEEVTPTEQQELAAAMERKDWHTILHFLRLCAPVLSAADLATLRGRAYDALGFPDYASVFFDQAAAWESGNVAAGATAPSDG
jgi:hypothetical protein